MPILVAGLVCVFFGGGLVVAGNTKPGLELAITGAVGIFITLFDLGRAASRRHAATAPTNDQVNPLASFQALGTILGFILAGAALAVLGVAVLLHAISGSPAWAAATFVGSACGLYLGATALRGWVKLRRNK